jgi:SAM-dependent methyltransferase
MNLFETSPREYDRWYEKNPGYYLSELKAISLFLPEKGEGVEIGVGTGRFADPLEVKTGVEPSRAMAALARERGIRVHIAKAESLPFEDETFDYALMVTVLSFLEDPEKAFREVFRILKHRGSFILGFISRDSFLGKKYQTKSGVFFQNARFYSPREVESLLTATGFKRLEFSRTLFEGKSNRMIQPVLGGHGPGGFVAVRGWKG